MFHPILYEVFVQNLVTVIQVHQGLCVLNYVEVSAGLHLTVQHVYGYIIQHATTCTPHCF